MVNSGVNVFKIPATELSILVCAVANRNEGIKIPIIPEVNNFQRSPALKSRRCAIATGKINKEAEATRREPTSSEVNALRPCLIRIKEVPHIRERIINRKMEVERGLSLI